MGNGNGTVTYILIETRRRGIRVDEAQAAS